MLSACAVVEMSREQELRKGTSHVLVAADAIRGSEGISQCTKGEPDGSGTLETTTEVDRNSIKTSRNMPTVWVVAVETEGHCWHDECTLAALCHLVPSHLPRRILSATELLTPRMPYFVGSSL